MEAEHVNVQPNYFDGVTQSLIDVSRVPDGPSPSDLAGTLHFVAAGMAVVEFSLSSVGDGGIVNPADCAVMLQSLREQVLAVRSEIMASAMH